MLTWDLSRSEIFVWTDCSSAKHLVIYPTVGGKPRISLISAIEKLVTFLFFFFFPGEMTPGWWTDSLPWFSVASFFYPYFSTEAFQYCVSERSIEAELLLKLSHQDPSHSQLSVICSVDYLEFMWQSFTCIASLDPVQTEKVGVRLMWSVSSAWMSGCPLRVFNHL